MMSKGVGLSSTAVQNHHEKTPFGGNIVGIFFQATFPGNPNILWHATRGLNTHCPIYVFFIIFCCWKFSKKVEPKRVLELILVVGTYGKMPENANKQPATLIWFKHRFQTHGTVTLKYSQFQSGLVAQVFCNCCRYCRVIITSNRVQKILMYQPLEDLWDEMIVCIFLFVFTGYCIYPSIMAVQSTLTQPFSDNKAIIRGDVHSEFPM